MTDRLQSEIAALAYVGIRTDRAEDWRAFAGGLLAMQEVDRGGGLTAWRMDDRKQRLIVDARAGGREFFGWEVVHRADLDTIAARLEAAGVHVIRGDRALCEARLVADLIAFDDPSGYRIEVCWKPAIADTPFVPGRPIAGFKTGPLGMGHAVLHTDAVEAMVTFYRVGVLRGHRLRADALPLAFLPRQRAAPQFRAGGIGAAGHPSFHGGVAEPRRRRTGL